MRKMLLLAALCMAATLVFAPMAMGQSASAGAEQTPDSPCPTDIDEFPLGTQCGEGGGYIVPDGGSVAPVITEDSSFEECDGGPSVETPDGTRCLPDASATASPSSTTASPSATASASATPTALPETGGPNPAAFALPSLALLVAGGIFAARLVRR